MRTIISILCLTSALCSFAQAPPETSPTPAQLLERGISSYRAGEYERAASELKESTQSYLAPEQMKQYVRSGEFEHLAELETALVYLALAQSKLGRTEEAREAVLRLMSAERIKPTYATLSLPADAADFTRLASTLVPDSNLLAGGRQTPPAVESPVPAPPSPPVQVAVAPPPPSPPPATAGSAPVVESQQEQQNVEQLLAEERARWMREAERRIEEARAAAMRSAEERIAAERAVMQQTFIPRDHFRALRDADVFAVDGELREANDIYIGLVNREGVAREVMIEAAIGLYRTGAFRAAAEAFQKLAPFRRGEEDVRFYFAVVLYETGVFEAAHHELSCALLFIQVTDDVARYRQKIELMAQRQASR